MWYNLVMVRGRNNLTARLFYFATIIVSIFVPFLCFSNVRAATATKTMTYNVNVKEYLSVSITEPSTWSSTNTPGILMCNIIGLKIITNNSSGAVVGMTSSTTTTALTNPAASSSNTIPTLAQDATANAFPSGRWGYTISSSATCSNGAFTGSGTFSAVPASNGTPGRVLYGSSAGTYTGNVYFGASIPATNAAGTYQNTVVFSAISGTTTINSNPTNPVNPSQTENTATTTTSGGAPSGTATVYTYTPTSSSATTTTQVSDGNNTSAYSGYTGYATPQGVMEDENPIIETKIDEDTPLATGLVVAAAVAAASGTAFFIAAKRKKDDDEEEEEKHDS